MNKVMNMMFAFLGLAIVGIVNGESLWNATENGVSKFKKLSTEEVQKLNEADFNSYGDAFETHKESVLKSIKDESVSKEDFAKFQLEMKAINDSQIEIMKIQGDNIKANNESKATVIDEGLKKFILENSEVLKSIKKNKDFTGGKMDFTLKGTQGAADITVGSDYAQFEQGTGRQPVRRTSIMDLFRRKKVSTEYLKYREENVVTRDAKMVVACASSVHTTKKTWINRTVELAKIRDIVDVCMDMLDDYDFVESEVRQLIEESVKLKAEYELLLGTVALATDMQSIDNLASEFNAANPLADFSAVTGTPFQDANFEQLVDAMSAQISVFGELNAWQADTVVMNFKDFVNYRNLKDANGNKLMHTLSDNVATIAGLKVVTSPIVVADTCYVFDSTKGQILDRQKLTVKTSFENNDNVEHETVTLVAVERLQFHVSNINEDAFMKCSTVAAAIALILKP